MEIRRCIRPPVPEVVEAQSLLRLATDAHHEGDRAAAAWLFRRANMPEVRAWTESLWGKGGGKLLSLRSVEGAPPHLPKEARVPVRMPNAAEQAWLIERDGHHCRFCGVPVIHARVRARAVALYPEAVTWGSTNASQHAAFQAMWLQFDHLLPHSRGGDNALTNVVITCAPCNYVRWHHTLEECGLANPLAHEPVRSDWNGLEDLL